MVFTPKRRPSRRLLVLAFIVAVFFLSTLVSAQEEEDPEPPTTTDAPEEPPLTTTMGPVVPAPSPTPVTPDPIFSTSDACVACKEKYATVRTCSSRIPVAGNLTMISQVLPFYQCVCPDNGSAIDALQQCSICLRSTGQQVFLNRAFYNVTNQDVKAMKEVCEDTANGTKVPSSSRGRWDMILSSASWSVVAIGALLLAPLGGL